MGGVFPDPGESRQRLRCSRELHPVLTRKHARHAMQTDRPVVIAHAAPGNDDISQGGASETGQSGETAEKHRVQLQNPSRLRLLKHDLGKKDPVLIGNAPPGKCPAVPVIPPQDARNDPMSPDVHAHASGESPAPHDSLRGSQAVSDLEEGASGSSRMPGFSSRR